MKTKFRSGLFQASTFKETDGKHRKCRPYSIGNLLVCRRLSRELVLTLALSSNAELGSTVRSSCTLLTELASLSTQTTAVCVSLRSVLDAILASEESEVVTGRVSDVRQRRLVDILNYADVGWNLARKEHKPLLLCQLQAEWDLYCRSIDLRPCGQEA